MMCRGHEKAATIVAVIGIALGGAFGMIGTFVTERRVQAACWGIDGVGLVVATALLTLQFFRKERDVVAAGFLPQSRFLLVAEPASFEKFVRILGQPAAARTVPPDSVQLPSPDGATSVAAQFGIEILGPPGIPN